MNSRSLVSRKRVLLPLVSLLLLVGAGWLAVHRSYTSHIIVYNQTGSPIALSVGRQGYVESACTQRIDEYPEVARRIIDHQYRT